ncbi:MAG: lamin tail domain-containing protein [Planctomycetota bacterium]
MKRTWVSWVFAAAGVLVGVRGFAQEVVINELNYNPLGSDDVVLLEFIELYNAESTPVDLSGWELDFGGTPFALPPGATIGAHSYVVVAESITNLFNATGYTAPYEWGSIPLHGRLDNGGEDVVLRDGPEGASTVIDLVYYDDDPPWSALPDGDGPTLELVNPLLDNTLPWSWLPSIGVCIGGDRNGQVCATEAFCTPDGLASCTGTHGTPGAQNSAFSNAPTVQGEVPRRLTAASALPSVAVTFSIPVSGVVAADLRVAGAPATTLECPTCSGGSGAGPYIFSGYTSPAAGSVTVALGPGVIQGGGIPFQGDTWTVSVGLVVVINEIHYHPPDPNGDAEFIELYNAGSNPANMAGWTLSDGVEMTFPPGTTLAPGAYRVLALNPTFLQQVTGYAGALAWTGGRLENAGERVALSDAASNLIDAVQYSDRGDWPLLADGDGRSAELVNPALPNEYGPAWKASTGNYGTPGAQNSVYQASVAPIITGTIHDPPIPAPSQSVLITATVIDDTPGPTVTLYYRQDQDPTIAYTSIPMSDDGSHGDGAAGDNVYGAAVSGLADGQRLDFTIRATDGTNTAAAPPGHNTLNPGAYPAQTYLCKFSSETIRTDFPHYHLITTQHTRNLQSVRNETEYDGTFLHCRASGQCEIYYNIIERYRGATSLYQNPPSFRISFSSGHPVESEMGFDMTEMNLLGQQPARQILGYGLFEANVGPAPRADLVRLNTSPLAHGGVQDIVYANVERIDGDFFASQDGAITPERLPNRCANSGNTCESDADCAPGETCESRDNGTCYRGRHDYKARLVWLGFDPDSYRVDASERNGYQVITNEDEDDWTDLINLCDALWCSTTDGGALCTEDRYTSWYPEHLEDYADVDQWAAWFALHTLLANNEGGIYRDAGDDYFLYFDPVLHSATLLPWDLDAIFSYADGGANQTIWRTTVASVQRLLRHNAFAGRFVGSYCDAVNTFFSQVEIDAAIDAIPDAAFTEYSWQTPQGDGPRTKQGMKDWATNRRNYVSNTVVSQTTLEGVPGSPYRSPNPTISLSGELNQCHTHSVVVNGKPVDYFSVYDAVWSHEYTLSPGLNTITVEALDHNGIRVDRADSSVYYIPPGGPLRMTMPTRMVKDKTLTLKAEIIDRLGSLGRPDWRKWNLLGTVSARRVSDQSPVPTSITVFETFAAGAGAGTPPEDSIRFYNGVGSVSITLDDPESVVGEDIEVVVAVDGRTASRVVTVLDNVPATFKTLSGTLSGVNLTWGPGDGVIHLTSDVTVPSGSTLTINAGTLVMVDPGPAGNGTAIWVSGNVNAQGTETEPIFFFATAGPAAMELPQTQQNNYSSWRGLYHDGGGTSHYSFVFVTGAGNGSISGHPRPPIFRFYGSHSLVMTDCMAADCPGKALHTSSGGSVTVSRCLFSRNGIGGEFYGSVQVLIEDSWFTRIGRAPEANSVDGDFLHLDNGGGSTIRRCILTDGGDDVIDGAASVQITVEDSIAYDARDKLLSLYGCCGYMDNVLAFNLSGAYDNSGGVVTQSTFAVQRNFSSGYAYTVGRTILWPGSASTCGGDVDYTLVGSPGHLGCGVGNFSADPLFVDAANHDYNLQPNSPAMRAGPGGERIGWLGFPTGQPCSDDSECDDGDACSADSCAAGACDHTPVAGCISCDTDEDCEYGNPCAIGTCGVDAKCSFAPTNEGSACDDGWPCTSGDQCAGGVCVGTVDCPAGLVCDPETGGQCGGLTVITFQDGVNGYNSTHDTFIREASPGSNNGAVGNWEWDSQDGTPAGRNIGLIRFDDIFGAGFGKIQPGSMVTSAILTLVAFDTSVAPAGDIHESLVSWSQSTAAWNNFGGEAGVQPDEVGGFVTKAPVNTGTAVIDVTASVQAWASDPADNFGWIFLPNSTNGLQVYSSEYATVALRPSLTVRFAAFCTADADCDDGSFCNGSETCNLGASFCEPGVVACPGRLCDEVTDICVDCLAPADCDDGDSCNGSEMCQAGSCVSGTALDCDDGVACTNDSCDPELGCENVNNCPVGDICNLSNGVCQPGPTALIESGAVWAYLDTGSDQGTAWTALGFDDSAWRYGAAQLGYGDGDETTVVRYGDDPANKYITTYFRHAFELPGASTVTNLTLNLLRDDGAIVYLNGTEIRRDNMPADPIDYLTHASDPPVASGDEVIFFSSTVSHTLLVDGVNIVAAEIHQNRPDSSDISFDLELIANTFCTDGGDCADGNVCNGVETCQLGLCLPGTSLDCDDSVACTNDSCDAALGCENIDKCPAGEVCNAVTGECEASAANPLPIVEGDTWTYFKGTEEPTPSDLTAWTRLGFDDDVAGWFTGPSGFGYGTDCAPFGTLLEDMENSYASLYTRRQFWISSPDALTALTLTVDYDDGFVAYLNGVEVARSSVVGTPPAFGQLATADHECFGGPTPNPPEEFDVSAFIGDLVAGANVLAIQAHNLTLGSSDFTLLATLDAVGEEPPTVEAVASRYLAVTPPPGESSVALRVESNGISCLPRYIDAAGHLVDYPVFRSSDDWGTVYVGSKEIIPSTMYGLRADARLATEPENLSVPAFASTWTWGDLNNASDVDVFDIVYVLDAFQDIFSQATLHSADLRGDIPNRSIDIFDIVAVLDAFQGLPYPGTPCSLQSTAADHGGAIPTGIVNAVSRRAVVRPGEPFAVDIYASRISELRGYQIALDLWSEEGVYNRPVEANAEVRLESIFVDTDRGDYVFRGLTSYPVAAESTGQLANAALEKGGDAWDRTYLGTYLFRVSKGYAGKGFHVAVRPSNESIFLDSANEAIMNVKANGAEIRVSHRRHVRNTIGLVPE